MKAKEKGLPPPPKPAILMQAAAPKQAPKKVPPPTKKGPPPSKANGKQPPAEPELDMEKIEREMAEWKAAKRGPESAAQKQEREERQAAAALRREKLELKEESAAAEAYAADVEAGIVDGQTPGAARQKGVTMLPLSIRVGFRLKLLTLVFLNALGISGVAYLCAYWKPAVKYMDKSRTAYNVLSLFGFGISLALVALNKVQQ
jgi:hypothetical protein